MHLREWLDSERGRYGALAAHLGVTLGRVSQMARDGVPKAHMLAVRDFTVGAVTVEEMLAPPVRPSADEPEPDLRGPTPTKSGNGHSPGMEPSGGIPAKATV